MFVESTKENLIKIQAAGKSTWKSNTVKGKLLFHLRFTGHQKKKKIFQKMHLHPWKKHLIKIRTGRSKHLYLEALAQQLKHKCLEVQMSAAWFLNPNIDKDKHTLPCFTVTAQQNKS